MKKLLGLVLLILSGPITLYVAVWWGLVEPVLMIADGISNETITPWALTLELMKIAFRGVLSGVIFYIMFTTGFSLYKSK